MVRTIIILVLAAVIIGSLGTASFVYYQRNLDEKGWDHVYLAESMIESMEYDAAIALLLPIVEQGKRFKGADYALHQLALAYERTGHEDEEATWRQLIEGYPQGEFYNEARMKLAWRYVETKPDEAQQIFEATIASASDEIKMQSQYGLAVLSDKNGDSEKAKDLYYAILENDVDWEIESKIKDRLTEMNHARLWSSALDEFSQLYEVQRGDAPVTVGQQFKTTAWYILEANGLKNMIHPGRRLKVPKEPFRLLVNKKQCRIELLTESGKFIKWYLCGVGKESYKTPAGEYTIINKEPDPVWYKNRVAEWSKQVTRRTHWAFDGWVLAAVWASTGPTNRKRLENRKALGAYGCLMRKSPSCISW